MNRSKKLLVFSDSHGSTADMVRIVRSEKPDLVLHLGDHASDGLEVEKETGIKVKCVKGNCDLYGNEPEVDEVIMCGHRLVFTHGHGYAVKYSTDRICYLADEREATAVFFGHTHMPFREYIGGRWVINPGSIALPRSGVKSYAMCLIGEYGVVPKIIEI